MRVNYVLELPFSAKSGSSGYHPAFSKPAIRIEQIVTWWVARSSKPVTHFRSLARSIGYRLKLWSRSTR